MDSRKYNRGIELNNSGNGVYKNYIPTYRSVTFHIGLSFRNISSDTYASSGSGYQYTPNISNIMDK